ncbi:tRNA threonylcarbamoyladenosine biosynthesis protein TsaE [Candidatus Cyrtobacter comes]|uniref:tRNA threonylcarbamoyladenosine biosynthesis protein TsaE n=1 Tax=Candidatus Cyrtobacter comes TaxID=675776 RepID=A0ABU5L7P5_9RICK|nr:tRNA (adenosine(37)-N6)-threonylcarbamoyltransferase complex ATPase subunit type 1 TsaE [Candidatus Cyrtobacter comes]MDZ5762151.1 tRNA threonylcarbamoyladenosine biosynthesis protein TsaE [Candidatus Cyrtobacter comes]
MLFKLYQEHDLQKVARYVVELSKSDTIIFLYGDLGSGKTSFVKYFMWELGMKCAVTSPTFNIMNIYTAAYFDVYHFDFYRIEDRNELVNIGLEDAMNSGLVIIEWPQIVQEFIHSSIIIEIKILNENLREISVIHNY